MSHYHACGLDACAEYGVPESRILPANTPVEWAIRLTWPGREEEPSYVRHFSSRDAAERHLRRYRDWPCTAELMSRLEPRPGLWAPAGPLPEGNTDGVG